MGLHHTDRHRMALGLLIPLPLALLILILLMVAMGLGLGLATADRVELAALGLEQARGRMRRLRRHHSRRSGLVLLLPAIVLA